MINHARTLLMNVAGPGLPGILGEEYVPPTFTAIELPNPLASVRLHLFGQSPDRVFINYRLQQFLNVLHNSELAQYLFDLDPRITYLPLRPEFGIDSTAFDPQIKLLAGSETGRFYLRGLPAPDEASGQLSYTWQITVTAAEEVTIKRLDHGHSETVVAELVVHNGLAEPIQLPGANTYVVIGKRDYSLEENSGGNFRLFGKIDGEINRFDRAMYMTPPYARAIGENGAPDASVGLTELVGTSWQVDVTARPQAPVNEIFQRLDQLIGEPAAAAIFGNQLVEPFTTFRAAWEDHPHAQEQLSGLLLGLIYRFNELRR